VNLRLRTALAGLAGLALAACGTPAPVAPPGAVLDGTRVLASYGPRIPVGSIFAAGDLETLRALVDVSDAASVRQLGGAPQTHDCMPPYTSGTNLCWPGERTQPGQAYLAVYLDGGFCVTPGPPAVYASGDRLVLRVVFKGMSGCDVHGTVALPTAALVAFPTGGLRTGLYRVSYLFQQGGDDYRSPATYLSIPSPAAGSAAAMEADASAALASVVGGQRAGVFSIARVDGAQIGGLCGQAVAGAADLVTTETSTPSGSRRMTVTLAGPTPRPCAVSAI
jgi:hypothetical protein